MTTDSIILAGYVVVLAALAALAIGSRTAKARAERLRRPRAHVRFGYEWFEREVQFDGDGRPFVMICGVHLDLLSEGDERWFPLNFPRRKTEVQR